MAEWEDYVIEGTNILRNKYGLNSQEELTKLENKIVVAKLSYLYIYGMKGNFDSKHLCELHRFLFGEIYDFAGKYRDIEMFKVTGFEKSENIPSRLNQLFNNYNNREVNTKSKFTIASFLADYYYELISIHPFREGNGRTSREFIRQVVLDKFPEYQLDYTKIDKKNFQIGVIDHSQYPSLLAYEIYNSLVINDKFKTNEERFKK